MPEYEIGNVDLSGLPGLEADPNSILHYFSDDECLLLGNLRQ